MDLTLARDLYIPNSVVDPTLDFLRDRGRIGCEGFVVWGGHATPDGALNFTSCYVPEQTAHKTEHGLLVTVDGDALFRMNRAFYRRNEVAAGQVHTHPTDAYHSETDDHYPLVTLRGALSLVIPDFAEAGRDGIDRWAWYRLNGPGLWESAAASGTRVFLDNEGS